MLYLKKSSRNLKIFQSTVILNSMKSYNQHCGIARALDVLGDRWTLLIVRELLPPAGKRYTDLQAALPGIATNLLASRLREMEANGIILRVEPTPPVATAVFRLTERGRELEPVLAAIGRWGIPLLAQHATGAPIPAHLLAHPLQLYLTGNPRDRQPTHIVLKVGKEALTLTVSAAGAVIETFAVPNPDLTLTGDSGQLLALMLKKLTLDQALAAGVTVQGDPSALTRVRLRD
jgi:DNA-binding HxlR family transcriptional regulator